MSSSRAKKSFIVLDLNSDSLNRVVFRNGRHPCENGAEGKMVLTNVIKTKNEILGCVKAAVLCETSCHDLSFCSHSVFE